MSTISLAGNKACNNFASLVHVNDAFPSTCNTGLLAAEVQVTFPVLFLHHHHFYHITGFQTMEVPELVQ